MSGVRLPRIAVARQRPQRRGAKVTGAIDPRGDEPGQSAVDVRGRLWTSRADPARRPPAKLMPGATQGGHRVLFYRCEGRRQPCC
jgi:hypothetical protein